MPDHHQVSVQPTTYAMFTPICSCGWSGCDWGTEDEAREHAKLHAEGKRKPWEADEVKVWDPQDRPFPGT